MAEVISVSGLGYLFAFTINVNVNCYMVNVTFE
jgi:hypothetical protein